jgi:hypothetical protein
LLNRLIQGRHHHPTHQAIAKIVQGAPGSFLRAVTAGIRKKGIFQRSGRRDVGMDEFPENPLPSVVEKAYKKGLILSDGTDYDTGKIKYNSVGLGFASLNIKEQEKAVAILQEVL